ncbi:MAG: VWA domain-containing protein, partial [Chlorobium sp.]|uniref:VWA domain-containing protein n=1 Tax=Chlorobium sp. TaxID=1095 RepID=UPI002F3F64CA
GDQTETLLTLDLSGAIVGYDEDGDQLTLDSGSLQIMVQDDIPVSIPIYESATATPIDTNLLIILDTSGSMGSNPGVSGYTTRMALSVDAAIALIDKYDALGEVKVRIVDFDSTGTIKGGTTWQTSTDAKNTLDGMIDAHTDAGQLTNYDVALLTAMDAYNDSGALTDAQSVSYFISDGSPTTNTNWDPYSTYGTPGYDTTWPNWGTNNGINNNERAGWEAWLKNNNVISYAIGLGTGINEGNMNPVAYDGANEVDMNGIEVPNLNNLDEVLSDTIPQEPLTGSLSLVLGADEGGYVKSLTVNSVTYTYDPSGNSGEGSITVSGGTGNYSFDTSTNVLTVNTADKAIIKMNMDNGAYEYKAPAIFSSIYNETIGFTLVDADGDTSSSSIIITNYPLPSPVNETWTGGDTGETKTASSVNAYLDGQGGNDTLTGSSGSDILKGGEGDDYLDGAGGSDVIMGYHGADTLLFDANDTVIDGGNGGGDDTLILATGVGINFNTLSNSVLRNIEVIDLTQNGVHSLTNLSLQDVIDMTDGNNTLYILGESSDSVDFEGAGWSFETSGGYKLYTNSNNPGVSVYIDNRITPTL